MFPTFGRLSLVALFSGTIDHDPEHNRPTPLIPGHLAGSPAPAAAPSPAMAAALASTTAPRWPGHVPVSQRPPVVR